MPTSNWNETDRNKHCETPFLSILVVAACKSGATYLRDIVALNIVDWLVA